MNNKSRKSSFLKNLLATASVASVIVGGSNAALGMVRQARITTATPANVNEGGGELRNLWGGINNNGDITADVDQSGPENGSAAIIGRANDIIDIDINRTLQAISAGNKTGGSVMLNSDCTVGSVVNTLGANFSDNDDSMVSFDFVQGDTRTLTLTGTNTTRDEHGFDAAVNDYTALGQIDFVNTAHTLTISSTDGGPIVLGPDAVIDNAELATLNVDTNFTTFESYAAFKTINIANNVTYTIKGNNNVNLQAVDGGGINFAEDSTLVLETTHGNADRVFAVENGNGSLAGGADGYGIISFDTTAAAGTFGDDVNNATVGIDEKEHRAKKFTITAAPGNAAAIKGRVYTKELELAGGPIIFEGVVDVGIGGITNIAAPVAVNLLPHHGNPTFNLGETDFRNTNSIIVVEANGNLKGNFYGEKGTNNIGGIITFNGDGALGSSDTCQDTATNLTLIQNTAAGTMKLSGHYTVNELKGTVSGTNFEFADGYKFKGNINETSAATSNLYFKGNAEIEGRIGVGGRIGDITILEGKKVAVGGDRIKATNILGKDDSGVLILTNNANDVIIDSTTISINGGGSIDATGMGNQKLLTITGKIGTNPSVNNSKALDRLLLSGQDLILDIAAVPNKFANIARIDFDQEPSTISLNVADGKYALGFLTNAQKAIFEVSENVALYNTKIHDNELKAIKFTADKILTLDRGSNIAAKSVESTNGNQGSIVFAGNAKLVGPLGTLDKPLSHLVVKANVVATTSGTACFNGDIVLGGRKSELIIDSNYAVNSVVSTAANKGKLRFVNEDNITFRTNAVTDDDNGILTLEMDGGNVTLDGNVGIKFKDVNFNTASVLTLAPGMKLNGINIDSRVNAIEQNTLKDKPIVVVSGDNHIIAAAEHIGDKDHLIDIQLASDHDISVKTKNFFSTITTKTNNTGKAVFDVGGTNTGVVYGIGEKESHLKSVTFSTSTENFGNTYVESAIINDGRNYTAGGTVSGKITVGSVDGGSMTHFKDGLVLTGTMTSMGADNNINFTDNVTISDAKLGTENIYFKNITFNGKEKANLHNAEIFAERIHFNDETIVVTGDKSTIVSGTSHINANINVGSSEIIFQGNQNKVESTWGTETAIETTLTSDYKLGKIVVATPTTVAANLPICAVIVKDHAELDNELKEYMLIDTRSGNLNNAQFSPLTTMGAKLNQAYAQWIILTKEDKNVYLLRLNDAPTQAPLDVKVAGGNEIDQRNATLFGREALAAATKIGLSSQDPEERGKAVLKLVKVEPITDAIDNNIIGISQLVGTRLNDHRSQLGVIGSGSSDKIPSIGIWAMPYSSQAVQRGEGGAAGCKVKSGGGVVGFDTLANNRLMIGTAVSAVKTDMKYKSYRTGSRTMIDTLMLSIYGSQQLIKDSFVQAVAFFGSNKVKSSDPVIANQVAVANYDSMTYGGEILFGYNAKVDSVLITPVAGLRYTKFSDEGYRETGTNNLNKAVSKKYDSKTAAVIGVRAATSIDTSSSIRVIPETHGFISRRLGNKSGKTDVRLDGMNTSFVSATHDNIRKTSYNLGLSVTTKVNNMEYGVGYDTYLANKYVGHQGILKVRVNL